MANPNIILQGRSVNPLAIQRDVQQLDQGRMQNMLIQSQMDQQGRALQSQNMLAGAYREAVGEDGNLDWNKLAGAAARAGQGNAIPGLLKGRAEIDAKNAEAQKDLATGNKTKWELDDAKRTRFMQLLTASINDPTLSKQKLMAMTEQEIAAGFQDPAVARAKVASLPDDPNELRNELHTSLIAMTTAEQRADDAREQAKLIESRRAREATDITTRRGQDMTNARSLESASIQRETQADARKAKLSEKETPKITDARDVLALLDQAEPLIEKATGSYAGQAVDEANRFFGRSTEGAQATAELKALEAALIGKMPKMSGPQSDKDVELYRQAAGRISDPTLPRETRKAAVRTIREINQRYLGRTSAGASASWGDSPSPSGGIKFLGFE